MNLKRGRQTSMDSQVLSIGFVVSLLFLLALGIPIGVVILILAAAGILLVSNVDPGQALATAYFAQMTSWGLTPLPLFVLMGEILGRSGTAKRLFDAFAVLLGRVPGGLVQVNVVAATMFAALSGSSTATVATIGKLSFHRLEERGSSRALSLGSLAGAGTLGILIPPSVALILYGFTFDVSIADLFLAGVVPGILVAIFFATYVGWKGRGTMREAAATRAEKLRACGQLVPILLLIAAVFGSIYGGFATPTEAAVIGVVGAIIIAYVVEGGMRFGVLVESFRDTILFCATLGFVLAASAALQVTMAYTGIPRTIVSLIQAYELSQAGLLVLIALILLVLGCFIDGLSMIVLTSAVLQPVIAGAGINPLWFGVFMVILVEIGLITPPIGFNLFVLQKVSGRDLPEIALAALPFMLILLASLVVFWLFPQLVTYLPSVL